MKLFRINAIVLRHLLLTFRSFDRILNIIYWPFINIVLWGVTSTWLQELANKPNIIFKILTGLVLWQIVFRVNLETAKSLFEEILNKNLINLFASPLELSEWIIAIMILGVINMVLVMFFGITATIFLYNINITSLGPAIILLMISLLLSGWFIGFFICGLLIYWGGKAQDFIYTIGWLFAPFSAIYYPLQMLPNWVQFIAKLLPTTYIFEAMRQLISTNTLDLFFIVKSFILNLVYLGFSLIFFKYMFEKSRVNGFKNIQR